MALQMSPDNLPGYLPPGTAPFRKCWKETSQVPSWHLCDCGMGGCGDAALSLFMFHLVPQAGVQETTKVGRISKF